MNTLTPVSQEAVLTVITTLTGGNVVNDEFTNIRYVLLNSRGTYADTSNYHCYVSAAYIDATPIEWSHITLTGSRNDYSNFWHFLTVQTGCVNFSEFLKKYPVELRQHVLATFFAIWVSGKESELAYWKAGAPNKMIYERALVVEAELEAAKAQRQLAQDVQIWLIESGFVGYSVTPTKSGIVITTPEEVTPTKLLKQNHVLCPAFELQYISNQLNIESDKTNVQYNILNK